MDAELLIHALGWTLIDFLWQGALIGVAYALLRAGLRRTSPRLRLFVGHLALLAFALAPMASLWQRLAEALAAPSAAAVASGALQESVLAMAADAGAGPGLAQYLLPTLVTLWLLGVLVLSLRGIRQWRTASRMSREASAAPAEWQALLDTLRARFDIGRGVMLRFSNEVAAPMLIGWLKPVILVPAGLCMRLPREQVELLLAHELAHVRRLDYLANLLQIAIETLLFYHPAVHWVSRAVRHDRELCCDDLVTRSGGNRLSYARALLALAEQRQVPGTALAASGGVLLARIEHIVGRRHRAVEESATATANGVLLLAGALLLATLAWRTLVPTQDASAPSAAPMLPTLSLSVAAPALEVARLAVVDLVEARRAPLRPAALQDAPTATVQTSALPSPPLAEDVAVQPITPAFAIAPQFDAVPALAPPAAAPIQLDAEPAAMQPRRMQAPTYPRRARLAGIEGSVTLSYQVDSRGRVVDARVLEATPARVFDRAALDAIAGWSFEAGVAAHERFVQTFDFRLDASAPPSRLADEGCYTQTGTRICRPAL